MQPIKIIFHICALHETVTNIADELVDHIIWSGLYDAATAIHITISGREPHVTKLEKHMSHVGSKIVMHSRPYDESYERVTLLDARRYITEDDLVLYIHSKGVLHIGMETASNVRDWRKYLSYHLVKKWKSCVHLLEHGNAHVVGVNFQHEPRPHFSGNFWWARGDYYLTLPATIGDGYTDPEFYVCQLAKSCNIKNIFSTHIDHYRIRYPTAYYIDSARLDTRDDASKT